MKQIAKGIIIGLIVGISISFVCLSCANQVSQPTNQNSVQNNQNVKNQITMKVINVDEKADAEYATVWLTPSQRIYKLAKNIPDYKTYLGLMEQSKKDGSLLTFTLDTDDPSVINSISK